VLYPSFFEEWDSTIVSLGGTPGVPRSLRSVQGAGACAIAAMVLGRARLSRAALLSLRPVMSLTDFPGGDTRQSPGMGQRTRVPVRRTDSPGAAPKLFMRSLIS
jgi:hypothetical protein